MAAMPKANRTWLISFGIVFVIALGLYTFLRHTNAELNDSDTRLILGGINGRQNPWSWFTGDWPLFNHFYRPVVSLLFEFDNAAHPHSTFGFAFTDVSLCFLSSLALFWFLREFFDRPLLAVLGTLLFVLWQWDSGHPVAWVCPWISGILLIIGFVRHGFRVSLYIPAVLVWWWLTYELLGITGLSFRMLLWIPGRTASTMTVFALVSMAAFARYLRLSPMRSNTLPQATALDRPATKSSSEAATSNPWIGWPILSVIALLLGLGSYEQAAMIPALLGLTALYFHFLGRRVAWGWGFAFAACLAGYLMLRQSVISHEPSNYWNWQKRTTRTALIMLQRYFFFPYAELSNLWDLIVDGPLLWMTLTPWVALRSSLAGLSALWEMRRRWLICGFGWLGSVLAYGPMAWFKDFDHYHYWPMAIRTIFVAGLSWVALDLAVTAVSPQAQQAPERKSPAAGSLLPS